MLSKSFRGLPLSALVSYSKLAGGSVPRYPLESVKQTKNIYKYNLPLIGNSSPIQLKDFDGKVVLITNVATYCSLSSRNYENLNMLVDKIDDPDFVAIGVPCNQFARKEPGNDEEILQALQHVRPGNGFKPNFLMTSKLDVNGYKEHPLFSFMKSKLSGETEAIGNPDNLNWSPIKANDIAWNFEKFLINQEGVPVKRYTPTTDPLEIAEDINTLLNGNQRRYSVNM